MHELRYTYNILKHFRTIQVYRWQERHPSKSGHFPNKKNCTKPQLTILQNYGITEL